MRIVYPDNAVRVVFEHGLSVCLIANQWHLENLDGGRTTPILDPHVVSDRVGFRPVIIKQQQASQHYSDLLLRYSCTNYFGIALGDVEQCAYRKAMFHNIIDLMYVLRAVQYHARRLCLQYSYICADYARLPLPSPRAPISTFGGAAAAYYEFDALVTGIRRTYDACRYILWRHFGPGKGSVPKSFSRTLPHCKQLPASVESRLIQSWETFGKEVTAYRDCIHHYCPIDFGISYAKMIRMDNGAWSTQVPIPDNATVQSRFKFTYAEQRDALRYGLRAADEVLEIVESIIAAVPEPIK